MQSATHKKLSSVIGCSFWVTFRTWRSLWCLCCLFKMDAHWCIKGCPHHADPNWHSAQIGQTGIRNAWQFDCSIRAEGKSGSGVNGPLCALRIWHSFFFPFVWICTSVAPAVLQRIFLLKTHLAQMWLNLQKNHAFGCPPLQPRKNAGWIPQSTIVTNVVCFEPKTKRTVGWAFQYKTRSDRSRHRLE